MSYATFRRVILSVAVLTLAATLGFEQEAWAQQIGSADQGESAGRVEPDAEYGRKRRRLGGDSSSSSDESDSSRRRKRRRRRSRSSESSSSSKSSSSRSEKDQRILERRRQIRNTSGEVTATVDVAVGPSFFAFGNPFSGDELLSGPIYEDQPIHYGLRFDAAAIIDYEFYRKNRRLVPRQYRGMFNKDTEIRYAPAVAALIPRNIYLSPKTKNTGVYGATWELARLGLTLLKSSSTKLGVGAGLLATYAYIDSDVFESTHFLRPGISVGLNLGTMFNETWGMSVGWDSNFYLPQDIGGGILEGSGDDALWHIGEGFLMFHYRFPYTTKI